MTIFSLIIIGLAVGVISSFFGVGGGVLIVPSLYFLFPDIAPETVIGSSLGLISINSLINLYNFLKKDSKIELNLLVPLALSMIPGIFVGSYITVILEPKSIKLLFAVVISFVAIRLILSRDSGSDKEEPLKPPSMPKMLITGLGGGILSGSTGLGGGAVMVPMFIDFLKIPLKKVSFLSNCVMPIGAFVGALGYALMDAAKQPLGELASFHVGHINYAVIIFMISGSFFSSKLGVKLSQSVEKSRTKAFFAAILILIASKIFYTQLFN